MQHVSNETHTQSHRLRWIISVAPGAVRLAQLKRLSVFVYIVALTVALAEAELFLRRVRSVNLLRRLTFAL